MASHETASSSHPRGSWNTRIGFIFAASGSAIGLGNIVFFSSNAYQYGGGAFYVPYFLALFALGLPIMILEFGLGTMTKRAFPEALYRVAGRKAEFVGWWALGSALFITMYYIAILGWAMGMMFGSFGSLFNPGVTAPFAPFQTPTDAPNATVFFFNLISTWWPLLAVLTVWGLNTLILWKGTTTIEKAVRVFVPLMWLFMIALIIRGLTLEGGIDGVLYLFTPVVDGITEGSVWRGAFSQMFFSLSLGLGTMTAYASYLPKNADQVNNSLLVSFMNCGFEYIAGIAIFSLLFVFALNPAGSTLSIAFFVIPQGIVEFPWGVRFFGFLFFFLLLIAGLTSSISLVEGMTSAVIDKLKTTRARALALVATPGVIGSVLCTLPFIVDPELGGNGTLGLTLVDLIDHWVFGYALLTVGLLQSIFVGWVLGAERLRQAVNRYSKFTLGTWFNVLIKYIVPAILAIVLFWNIYTEVTSPLYGSPDPMRGYEWLPVAIPLLWLSATIGIASYFTYGRKYSYHDQPPASLVHGQDDL